MVKDNRVKGSGFSISSFILAICSLIPFLGILFAILAVTFGIVALVKDNKFRGLAVAGIIIGIFLFLVQIIFTAAGIIYAVSVLENEREYSDFTRNEGKFTMVFFLNDTQEYIDGEVFALGKSVGLTQNGSLTVDKKELFGANNVYFKTNYLNNSVILPYELFPEDLYPANKSYVDQYGSGIYYITTTTQLASNEFNITEEDILTYV